MKFKLLATLLTVSLTGVASCGHVTVYDSEWCGDLGKAGAHCAHTLTDATREIEKSKWDETRIGMLCTSSQGFNDTETAIDQLCLYSNLCDYATRQEIARALSRIRKVAIEAQKAKGK